MKADAAYLCAARSKTSGEVAKWRCVRGDASAHARSRPTDGLDLAPQAINAKRPQICCARRACRSRQATKEQHTPVCVDRGRMATYARGLRRDASRPRGYREPRCGEKKRRDEEVQARRRRSGAHFRPASTPSAEERSARQLRLDKFGTSSDDHACVCGLS